MRGVYGFGMQCADGSRLDRRGLVGGVAEEMDGVVNGSADWAAVLGSKVHFDFHSLSGMKLRDFEGDETAVFDGSAGDGEGVFSVVGVNP